MAARKNDKLLFLLEEMLDEKNFFAVCCALFKTDQEVSVGAALALGHMQDARAVPYLLRALLTTNESLAEAVIWALGEIKDEESIPFLCEALRKGFMAKSAIVALAKIGSPAVLSAIMERLYDPSETIRVLALKGLSMIRFQDKTMISLVLDALKHKLDKEDSRRVKLLIAVACNRFEKDLPRFS